MLYYVAIKQRYSYRTRPRRNEEIIERETTRTQYIEADNRTDAFDLARRITNMNRRRLAFVCMRVQAADDRMVYVECDAIENAYSTLDFDRSEEKREKEAEAVAISDDLDDDLDEDAKAVGF